MNTPLTSDTRLKGIKLDFIPKYFLLGVAFITLEGST